MTRSLNLLDKKCEELENVLDAKVKVKEGKKKKAKPEFQKGIVAISLTINDLRQIPFPVSGYTAINRSASACSASASVTWRNVAGSGALDTTHVFRHCVAR
jgi:hypothetical protein